MYHILPTLPKNSFRVFCYLLYRNFLDTKSRLRSLIIDGLLLMFVDTFLIARLFPLFNIPLEFLAPLFVADTFLMLLFIQGDTFCLRMVLDVINNRFIYYNLTLPIHWSWIFLSFCISFMIETTVISLPLMTFGTYFFSTMAPNISIKWGFFVLHYFVALFFISTFFLSVTFRYPYSWIENNLWPRLLLPMFCIGATTATWYQVFNFSPLLAYIGLLNPLTYFAEGFRYALLSGHYLPFFVSVSMLFLASLVNIFLLYRGILKRLDPV